MNIELSDAEKIKILNSDDLYSIMQRILLRESKIDRDREHFWVIGLATNSRLLFIELISMGTVNQTLATPMEVFSFALQKRAVKIILVHNHPSGELKPSEADKNITDRLIQVGIIVDTEVLDHPIISENSYLSFLDTGLLAELKRSTKYVPAYKLQQEIKKEAKAIGEAAGLQKGIKQVARAMKDKGVDVELIAETTGLTKKQIERL